MKLTRVVARIYLRIRRKGFFSYIGYIHFLFSKYNTSLSSVELMKPMELISGSKLPNVDEELLQLEKLHSKQDFYLYFSRIKQLDRNKQFRINAFHPLFYLLETEKHHKLIVRFITNYCKLYLVNKKANDFVWYDMADAFRLSFLIHVCTECCFKKLLSIQERKILMYSIERHAKYVSLPNYQSSGNHGIFQVCATLLYGKSCNNSILVGRAESLLKDKFLEQFSERGIHLEHSPEYHIWAVILFSYIKNKIVDLNVFYRLGSAVEFSRLLFNTSNEISLIGDSGKEHSAVYGQLVQIGKRNDFNFLCSEDGYLVTTYYSRGFYFISHFGAHSKAHKHQDSTSFELDIRGVKVVTDSGKFSYTKSSFSNELRSVSGHNIVNLDKLASQNYTGVVIYESKILQFTKLVNQNEHSRFFITLVNFGVIVIDVLPVGNVSSTVNFTSEQAMHLYTPLSGIIKVTSKKAYYSDTYLKKRESVRLSMVVESISAYSILSESDKLNCFKILNKKVSFNFKSKNYKFDLE